MRVAFGLDCGGSTCRALALDEAGRVVYEGRSGPANIASTPPEEIQRHLAECLEGCPSPTAVVGCFAGLLTEADRGRAISLLSQAASAPLIQARADFEAALTAGGEIDGLVIAGTGSVICSHSPEGIIKSGGGGPLLGDEGSLFHIGRLGLWHTALSARRLPMGSALAEHLCSEFGSEDANEVIAGIYRGGFPAQRIGQIGAAVVRDYEQDEPYAVQCVGEALKALAEECGHHFRAAAAVRLGLAGGLWKICPRLAGEFADLLNRSNAAPYSVSIIEREPVEGAAQLALQLLS